MNNKLKLNLKKAEFQLKKFSPEILMGVGVVGVVASTVLACKATLKVNDILEDSKEKLDKVKTCQEDEQYAEEYSVEDAKKDKAIIYTQTAVKMAKLYGPAVVLGTASIGCIVTSNNILKKRNVALAAAYTTIDKSYKEYRKRVADRFGEEVERQIKYDIKAEQIEEKEIGKNGKEKTVKKNIDTVNPIAGYSDYARFFDDGCTGWEKDSEYNLCYLKAQQQYANDLLRANGFLFLNDVYEMLGIPRTKAGQVVGWIYDEENPIGDNYVDFGIYDTTKRGSVDFVNGFERTILLDFNVDGNIWDLM